MLLCLWDFPGKNTGVGCHFLLQGIFPTRYQTRICCIGRRILSTEPPGKPTEYYSTLKRNALSSPQKTWRKLEFFFFFLAIPCRILVPQSGIKPMSPALGAHSLNNWTTREVPWMYIASWKNTIWKGYILYDSNCKKFRKPTEIVKRPVVAKGFRGREGRMNR